MVLSRRYVTIQRGRGSPQNSQVGNEVLSSSRTTSQSRFDPDSRTSDSRFDPDVLAVRAARLNRLRVSRLGIDAAASLPPVRQLGVASPPEHARARGGPARVKRETVSVVFPSSAPAAAIAAAVTPVEVLPRAPKALPRTQGVSYVFPQSGAGLPQLRRDERQIDISLPAEDSLAAQDSSLPAEDNKEEVLTDEDYEDYEGWETEVSVEKSISQHFSVSSVVNSLLEAVSSTIAPLITTVAPEEEAVTTAAEVAEETTTSEVPTTTTTTQEVTTTTTTPTTTPTTTSETTTTVPKISRNSLFASPSKRVHPFLVSKKKAAEELRETLTTTLPPKITTRHSFFGKRPAAAAAPTTTAASSTTEGQTEAVEEEEEEEVVEVFE